MSEQWREADEAFKQLADAARNGDAYAQGKMLQIWRPYLLHRARQGLRSLGRWDERPSDVVQDAFWKALDEINSFKGCTLEQAKDWPKVILDRTLMNGTRRLRAHKRDSRREVANPAEVLKSFYDSGRSPEQAAEQTEERAMVARVLKLLPSDYSEVLFFWGSGLSWAETGARMGRSADDARMLFKRAMARFKEHIKGKV